MVVFSVMTPRQGLHPRNQRRSGSGLHPAPPRAGTTARVCFCGRIPRCSADAIREQMPFIQNYIRKFDLGLTSNVFFFSHCNWDLEIVH